MSFTVLISQIGLITRNPTADTGALEDPDSCKYFRPVSTIRSGSQSSNHSEQSSHASDGTASPPDSPQRPATHSRVTSPSCGPDMAHVQLRNKCHLTAQLPSVEYPLVAVKQTNSLECPTDKYESLLVPTGSIALFLLNFSPLMKSYHLQSAIFIISHV